MANLNFDTEYCFDCQHYKENMKRSDDGIRNIAAHYGKRPQMRMLQEECAELIKAVNKVCRQEDSNYPANLDNLIEEIADVEIMTAQIKGLYGLYVKVEVIKQSKILRTLQRIREEQK